MSPRDELAAAVQAVLDEPRNGMNEAFRHGMCRRFYYSDGAQELAEVAGCYWLLDIIGTEAAPKLLQLMNSPQGVGTAYIEMTVSRDSDALITLTVEDGAPPAWSKSIPFTDFPEGHWVLFEVGPFDDAGIIAILPSEH